MKRIRIIQIIVAILFITGVVAFQLHRENQIKKFHSDAIDAICIDYSDWLGNSRTFYLEGGYTMILLLERESNIDNKMKVGDRIKKEANTKTYHVYRKDDHNEYILYSNSRY